MLRRNILISCFVSSFLIISYSGSTSKYNDIALSQSEPEIKYDRQSVRQVKKYKPVKGAVKKKNPKGLAKKTRPKDRLASQDEVFIDEAGVKIFPDGTNIYKDGTNVWADGTTVYPGGITVHPDGTTIYPDGSIATSDGTPVEIELQVLSPNEGASSK
ncbi:MAG: hypothetical protein LH702_03395 [Phormidesmis sp. CAN_BIN44]|nr:hypothetical protein [Phormidesmis sp. CAN_BIN44]